MGLCSFTHGRKKRNFEVLVIRWELEMTEKCMSHPTIYGVSEKLYKPTTIIRKEVDDVCF